MRASLRRKGLVHGRPASARWSRGDGGNLGVLARGGGRGGRYRSGSGQAASRQDAAGAAEDVAPRSVLGQGLSCRGEERGRAGDGILQVDIGRDGRMRPAGSRFQRFGAAQLHDLPAGARARAFRRALDARGKPTTDSASGRIHWTLSSEAAAVERAGAPLQVIEPIFSPSRQTSQIGQSSSF